jgi:hypothetical protein
MPPTTPGLDQVPLLEHDAHFRQLRRQFPVFRTLYRNVCFLRLLISGVMAYGFFSMREHWGMWSFVGLIVTHFLLEGWLRRLLVIPFAKLLLARQTEECGAPSHFPG